MTSLDVTGSTELQTLYCYKNYLESLNLKKNTKLTKLDCSYNGLLNESFSYLGSGVTIKNGNQGIVINEKKFPDERFRKYLNAMDDNKDGLFFPVLKAAILL